MKKQSYPRLSGTTRHHWIIFFFAVFCGSFLSAQDRIILKNGNTLEARVTEIQSSEIKYKRFDNLNGPVYSLPKSDVFIIMYENGTKEIIGELPAAPAHGPVSQSPPTQKRASAPAPRQKQVAYPQWSSENIRKNIAIGGLCLPLSADGVKLGAFAGYEHLWTFSEKFGIMGHGSLSFNRLKLDYFDYYYGYSYTFKGSEFNTRIMAGPAFRLNAGPSVAFYSTGYLGGNINFFTGEFSEIPKTLSLAYGGGTGLIFNEGLDIGLRFINHTAFTATPMLYVSAGFRF